MRDERGVCELLFFRLQPCVDVVARFGRQSQFRELPAKRPHAAETGNDRRRRGEWSLEVELLLCSRYVAGDRAQRGHQGRWRRAARKRCKSWNRGINAVKERCLLSRCRRRGHNRFHKQVALRSPARWQREQLRHRLTLVHAALFGADLDVRAAEQRIESGNVERGGLQRTERQGT
jgi:hypothetical protein